MGITPYILKNAAGFAQLRATTYEPRFGLPFLSKPYGDDPVDQYWIQAGIDYYNENFGNSSCLCH